MGMKISGRTFLVIWLLLSSIKLTYAQHPVISAPELEAVQGSTISTPIQVASFEDILGLQFTLVWDTDLLEFESVDQFAIEGMSEQANFGKRLCASGKLTFSWHDPALQGVSLDDGAVLFQLHFRVIGEEGGAGLRSELSFTGEPTALETTFADYRTINTDYQNGGVTIRQTTSTKILPNRFSFKPGGPNPFRTSTSIRFEAPEAVELRMRLVDDRGRAVAEWEEYLNAGVQELNLPAFRFPGQGTYFLYVLADEFYGVQKLIHL